MNPIRAACAATAFARFPVEEQPTVSQPKIFAFANATDTDRLAIEAAKLRPAYKVPVLPKPVGPGKEWTTADLVSLEGKLKSGRNFKNGEKAYAAARCVVCHRFGGDGGATGPDLSQVAGRFGLKDLSESIV